MDKPRSVLSLIRVSGDTQIDRTGVPRQIEEIADIGKEHNLVVAKGNEYRFLGLSGAEVEQSPEFRAMLNRLNDPKLAGIVCAEISRLFRPEFVDQLGISKPFRENGKLIFYEDGVLDLRKDRDMRTFISEAMAAGAHRKKIVKWTQWGKNQRRKEGNCKSDSLPAGVKFVPHPKTDPKELVTGHFEYTNDFYSERIKTAFRRILAGDTQTAIARDLKFGRPGKPSPTALRNALQSRWWIQEKEVRYRRVGRMRRHDGTVYDGKRELRPDSVPVKADFNGEPPLVSREDFDAVQNILADAHKTWTKTKANSTKHLEPYLGRTCLYCECGMKMYPKPFKRKASTTLYYMCSSNANGNKKCGRPFLYQHVVDKELRVFATLRMTNANYLNQLKPAEPDMNRAVIQKEIGQLTKQYDRQIRQIGKTDDVRNDDKMMALAAETQRQIDSLEEQLQSQPKIVKYDHAALKKKFLNFGKMPLDEQRTLIQKTFKKIMVDTEGSITGVVLR